MTVKPNRASIAASDVYDAAMKMAAVRLEFGTKGPEFKEAFNAFWKTNAQWRVARNQVGFDRVKSKR